MPNCPLWLGTEPLLLASTSAVRRSLLERAGIPVEVQGSGLDERALEASVGAGLKADALALLLACEKALAVSRGRPGRIVIGADQVLEVGSRTWPKPRSATEACDQLARLAGRAHRLHSALAVARDGQIIAEAVERARLTVRELDSAEIATYVAAAGEAATRSAGGYEVESLGIHLFNAIEGEHSTILGLPLLPTLSALRRLGLLAL